MAVQAAEVNGRIEMMRGEMKKRGITMYIVPTSDFHESEYVGDYFKARSYLTGFTGSAGTAVITLTQAGLWTDGRYFIQAKQQLKGSEVVLYRMGEEGVPTVEEFVRQNLAQGGCLGFDGRVVNGRSGETYEEIVSGKQGTIAAKEDLAGIIWKERPPFPKHPAFLLGEEYAGEDTESKLKRVREKMKEHKADVHILTSLYDIAWLLNIRGGDIAHVPVVMSFAAVTMEESFWFVHHEVLDDEILRYCAKHRIIIKDYEDIYAYAGSIPGGKKVLLVQARMVCL